MSVAKYGLSSAQAIRFIPRVFVVWSPGTTHQDPLTLIQSIMVKERNSTAGIYFRLGNLILPLREKSCSDCLVTPILTTQDVKKADLLHNQFATVALSGADLSRENHSMSCNLLLYSQSFSFPTQ